MFLQLYYMVPGISSILPFRRFPKCLFRQASFKHSPHHEILQALSPSGDPSSAIPSMGVLLPEGKGRAAILAALPDCTSLYTNMRFKSAFYPLYGFSGKEPPPPTTFGFAVLPGAFPPFSTRTMLMPSSRLASPLVPAITPFFAYPSQP